jgi:hypothetical protein
MRTIERELSPEVKRLSSASIDTRDDHGASSDERGEIERL